MICRSEGQFKDPDILRLLIVEATFRNAIGKRALILTEEFPFMVIGQIVGIIGDFISIHIETTHIDQLEGQVFSLNLGHIEVFYIEEPGRPIPRVCNDPDFPTKRGDHA